jgi:hypothetical protein
MRHFYPQEEINRVLHIIRNPYGWSEEEVRAARLKAADIIEWLERRLKAHAPES